MQFVYMLAHKISMPSGEVISQWKPCLDRPANELRLVQIQEPPKGLVCGDDATRDLLFYHVSIGENDGMGYNRIPAFIPLITP